MLEQLTGGERDDAYAFIRSIADNPDDDLPRLVFADWLDDHVSHDEGCRELAEFIRLDIRQWVERNTLGGEGHELYKRRIALAQKLVPPSCRRKDKFPTTCRGLIQWGQKSILNHRIYSPTLDDAYWLTGAMVSLRGNSDWLATELAYLTDAPHLQGLTGLSVTVVRSGHGQKQIEAFFENASIVPRLQRILLSGFGNYDPSALRLVSTALERGAVPVGLTVSNAWDGKYFPAFITHKGLRRLGGKLPWASWEKWFTPVISEQFLTASYIPWETRHSAIVAVKRAPGLREFLERDWLFNRHKYDTVFRGAHGGYDYQGQLKVRPGKCPWNITDLILEKTVFQQLFPSLKVD